MLSKKIKLTAAVGVTLIASAPGMASAVSNLTSYQGSDYSWNNGAYSIYACDQENDSHDVSADWVQSGTSTEYHVVDSYGNGCSSSGTGYLYRHRAVELLPGTDAYGSWVYPN
ncbi:MAG: hypothetical protein M3Y71_19095 [Actinomycetota bacterium]|nr:hypothetical protein [Actinomycetota bacterium]